MRMKKPRKDGDVHMAQTCKHGTRPDRVGCLMCAQETGEALWQQIKIRGVLSQREVLELLETEIKKFGTQQAFAKAIGVSASFINDILNGKRAPTGKVLDHLRLVKTIGYIFIR